jgi:hypothetical protein
LVTLDCFVLLNLNLKTCMDNIFYLTQFENAARLLNPKKLKEKNLNVEVGYWLNSIVLRMQKKQWANKTYQQPQTETGIFFSIWINNKSTAQKQLLYNIHALKLRELKGYAIKSRAFASDFRNSFEPYKINWPNVNLDFGPQTLMQGWEKFDSDNIENNVLHLANQFLTIDSLIDNLLENYKKVV